MIEILNEIANSTTLFIVGAWFGLVITIVLIILFLWQIFCECPQNLVKQRITPHFLTKRTPNYYEFTTKE